MKDLQAIRGRRYLLDLIAEGEHECQDFKFSITDACKIARGISAFANRNGGRLLIGVKDNGTVAGVRNEEDIYVVEQAAQLYCRPAQHVEFTAFRYDATAVVIRASIARADERPVQARDTDGTWSAYYRVADENIHAHPLMVATWRRAPRSGGLDHVAAMLGLSRQRAAGLITRLAAIGLLDFRYLGGSFRLVAPD